MVPRGQMRCRLSVTPHTNLSQTIPRLGTTPEAVTSRVPVLPEPKKVHLMMRPPSQADRPAKPDHREGDSRSSAVRVLRVLFG